MTRARLLAVSLLLPACRMVSVHPGNGDTSPDHIPGESGDTDTDEDSGSIDTVPDAGDPSDLLFDGKVIPTFGLTLTEEAILALASQPYEYVEGVFTWEDLTIDSVGVRLKAQNSFEDIYHKPAFKVKFDWIVPDRSFLGLKDITLNNMHSDYSMMHERVAYKIFRDAGLPASRSGHALVYVNGDFYGLYAHLENLSRDMVSRWYENEDGTMWELWDTDFTRRGVEIFELEWGKDDRSNLRAVALALESEGEAALADAGLYLNLDSWAGFWAGEAVVGQFDAYPYGTDDCHVFLNPDSGLLDFFPWGMDETWFYADYTVESAGGLMGTRCGAVESCRDLFRKKVFQILDSMDANDTLLYFDQVRTEIDPWIRMDDHKPYGQAEVDYYQEYMRDMIGNRRSELERQLGG